MTASTNIAIAATALTASLFGSIAYHSRTNVVTAGFWFEDDLTFEMPSTWRFGTALTTEERMRVECVARGELVRAFADFRVSFVPGRNAFYRVAVRQVLTLELRPNRRWSGAAGQSNVFGPLGGYGGVSFYMMASQAITFAPPGATRDDIVNAIGRGIGRAAVHEFTHQILPHVPIHATRDAASYEFGSSNRRAQYYGKMRWSIAHAELRERLGR